MWILNQHHTLVEIFLNKITFIILFNSGKHSELSTWVLAIELITNYYYEVKKKKKKVKRMN